MNEPSKAPFEPIPMPGLPAMPSIPEMPAIPEMPRPSFSRSANPPIPRRPLMIEDEKPSPFVLPPGIAAEAAAPVPLPPAPPEPATGGALSWLKPSRGKGVVFAGLASLGIGAFGLNALVPTPVREAPKPGSLADAAIPAPTKTPTTLPKIVEERPAVEPPALLAREIVVKAEDPWARTPDIKLVEGTTPAPIAVPPIAVPPALPTVPEPSALPVPVLTVPDVKPVPVPGLPPVNFDPVPEPTTPKIDLTPKVEPKPVPVFIAPVEDPKAIPVLPLPMPLVTPEVKPAPTPVPPMPEPKKVEPAPFPPPLPVPVEKTVPTAPGPVDAKTDYDVDIHKLKSGDTYAAISQKFYGTASYAGALRSYNDGLELARMRDVQVPPMHVIKKFGTGRDTGDAPRVLPVGVLEEPKLVAPPGIEREIEWGTPGSRKADKPADGGVNWR